MIKLSKEAIRTLDEIIDNENVSNYWEHKFMSIDGRDKALLRECFEELTNAKMISKVTWGLGYPWNINVLKDGYLYSANIKGKSVMSQFERELDTLLERANHIKKPVNGTSTDIAVRIFNQESEDWLNDAEVFYDKYLKSYALSNRIRALLFHRDSDCLSQIVSCFKSVAKDQDFIDRMNGIEKKTFPAYQTKSLPAYDVFLSHANADKQSFVDELNNSLEKLGVKIFYDKKSLEWGDKWKDRILDGTQKAEFAIIVISENFFDREWTEKELNEFLNRQNRNGQKLILPIVHNITNNDLKQRYPSVAEIQAIDSQNYSCDEIALLFARQLIKRLKVES